MQDWHALAKARGFDIPAGELGRIAAVLSNLDAAFRPLLNTLKPEMEPSLSFRADEVTRDGR